MKYRIIFSIIPSLLSPICYSQINSKLFINLENALYLNSEGESKLTRNGESKFNDTLISISYSDYDILFAVHNNNVLVKLVFADGLYMQGNYAFKEVRVDTTNVTVDVLTGNSKFTLQNCNYYAKDGIWSICNDQNILYTGLYRDGELLKKIGKVPKSVKEYAFSP